MVTARKKPCSAEVGKVQTFQATEPGPKKPSSARVAMSLAAPRGSGTRASVVRSCVAAVVGVMGKLLVEGRVQMRPGRIVIVSRTL